MGFILGFGETESRLEEKLEERIRTYVAQEYASESDSYFSDSFKKAVGKWIEGLADESREVGDRYKAAANYPDRYSYFWVTTLGDASHIVFILKFHHINRRHAFSPDGWACMTSERIFYVDEWEAVRAKRDAA